MKSLIKLAEIHPKIVFQQLRHQFTELSNSERESKLIEYRSILGDGTVDDLLVKKLVLKDLFFRLCADL
jgi:hypothetical protein